MQQRPILFSTPMVQAILEGRKTMTRRVVKHKTEIENISAIIRCLGNEEDWGKFKITDVHGEDFIIKSKYNIGGVLWVRETFALDVYGKPTLYKAENEINPYAFQPSKWKPSIFMPKEACRIFLKITDVRIERLQDISETDALKEGIDISKLSGDFEHTPTYEFKDLWEKINGKGSWELDPFVWVVSFENFKPE